MATESIPKLDGYKVAAAAEPQNRERNRERGNRKAPPKDKAAPLESVSVPTTSAPDLASSQIVDSTTVIELLSHRPLPNTHARFLAKPPPKASPDRRNSDGKKLDKSA